MAERFREYLTRSGGIRAYLDVTWKGKEVRTQALKRSQDIVKEWGDYVVESAKGTVHVITGTLRDSIHAEKAYDTRTGSHVLIVADAVNDQGRGYAIYEELLHPYMQPALQESQATLKSVVERNKVR